MPSMRHKRPTKTKEPTPQSPPPLICTLPKSPLLPLSLSLSLSPPSPLLSLFLSHPSMRIRRRPQSLQALSSLHPSSDPSTAPQPPPRNHGRYWLSVDKVDEEEKKSERLHLHPNADLADDDSSAAMRAAAALPLFPQDNAVVECSKIRPRGGAQQGAADGHRRYVKNN
jgi:hypothetical protein